MLGSAEASSPYTRFGYPVVGDGAIIRQVTRSIAIVDTEALGEPGVVAAYLVHGKENALIDMGYHSSAATITHDLSDHRVNVDYLLPTHVHLDHCGSCGALAEAYPHATVRVHPRGQPHLSDPSRLIAGARQLFGDELISKYGLPVPISANRVRNVSDDEEIGLGGGVTLRAIWTPGHASHHVSYFLEGDGALLTGDAVGVRYPIVPTLIPTSPPPSFNLEKAVESLERLRSLSPSRLYTPHFGVLDNASGELERNLHTLAEWKSKFEKLLYEKSNSEEIIESVLKEVRALREPADLPGHLRVTIRLSVMGFLGYLNWKAEERYGAA